MSLATLPPVEIVRRSADDDCDDAMPVLSLRWDVPPSGGDERLWDLPRGARLIGPPPRQFGLRLSPTADGAYALRLHWDGTRLSWPALSRGELLACSLGEVLAALGQDLWAMIDRPVGPGGPRRRAA